MRGIHEFENGIKVYDDQLLEVQRDRYKKKNVHEEEEEHLFISKVSALPPNATFVNVGAAIGYYCLLARSIRSDISIHGFEPLPHHLKCFRDNIKLNGYDESVFEIHEVAISSKSGKTAFIDSSYGSSLLHKQHDRRRKSRKQQIKNFVKSMLGKPIQKPIQDTAIYVSAIELRDIYKTIKCQTIDFLQMDIQGFEEPVLRSYFSNNIPVSQGQIKSFLIGTHGKQIHNNCRNLLEEAGFLVEHDEQAPLNQPDGILLCSLKSPTR